MKKILLTSIMAVSFLGIHSCDTQKTKEISVKYDGIPYQLAKNYYINNTITSAVPTKIETAEEFEKYFGMAAVMGKDGEPTKIDFTKEYIAVIDYGETTKSVEIIPQKVTSENGKIIIEYSLKEGKDQGFTTRPFQAIIIENSHNGEVVLKKI